MAGVFLNILTNLFQSFLPLLIGDFVNPADIEPAAFFDTDGFEGGLEDDFFRSIAGKETLKPGRTGKVTGKKIYYKLFQKDENISFFSKLDNSQK